MTGAPETLGDFLLRLGIGDKASQRRWFKRGAVRLDGRPAGRNAPVAAGQALTVRGKDYRIGESGEAGRLTARPDAPGPPDGGRRIAGPVRVQCGYHKCLTVFFRRVSKKAALWANPFRPGFRHFWHRADEFYLDCDRHVLTSLSGHCLDLDRFDDIRAVHLIRDPRDMVVSGYHYHRRAAEAWCDYLNPTDEDWRIVNAPVPAALPAGTSFADYLHAVSLEEGLAAEIDFRRHHFDSMRRWPVNDDRVLTLRYEDVIGNEAETFRRIHRFYGFAFPAQAAAACYADRYSLKGTRRHAAHIRNPNSGQWKDHFTPELERLFTDRYGDLLEKYGY